MLVAHMMNNFYYCGKLSLKLLIFLFDKNVYWNTQNAPDCTDLTKHFQGIMPRTPQHESESTSLQGYLRAWYVIFDVKKEKAPYFLHFFGLGGGRAIALRPPL